MIRTSLLSIAELEARVNELRKEKAEEIIRMRKDGMTLEEIGKLYGVTRQRIHRIIKQYEKKEAAR